MFILHPQLEQDCFILGHFPLSQLLLMNDASYPWFILVPQRNNLQEVYQLREQEQQQLNWESTHLAEQLASLYRADKMNIAALGNMVPQLHIHHIVRYQNDPAWPKPVWGMHPAKPYADEKIQAIAADMKNLLAQYQSAL